jgi:8-oxo-dGTP pyrophosphatase MutT (NUDIX family)
LQSRQFEILRKRTPRSLTGDHFRPAAVLVPIQQRGDGDYLVLTQRAENLNHHSGQVAFPGGSIDPRDSGPLEAALRESHEEIGIYPRDVRVVGQLDPIPAAFSYMITPFVGLIPFPYAYALNLEETTAVFEVPVAALMDHRCLTVDTTYAKGWGPIYHFQYEHWDIWGATAKIVKQLLELVYGFREHEDIS